MFPKKFRLAALLMVSALVLAACNLPFGQTAVPTPDVMGTVAAVFTQTALAMGLTPAALPPTATDTPSITDTPSPTATPTFTSTPEPPLVYGSVDTNCRVGPGKIYDWVGALMVGETTEVIGRVSDNEYYYVRNPDVPGGFCWLWANYASTTGNVTVLPVFTPPPTPTPAPDFTVTYEHLETCVGWDPAFKLTNTGGITFRSVTVTVKDTDTGTTVTTSANFFDKRNGCAIANPINALQPGAVGWAYASSFAYDPSGNDLTAIITVCSQKDLAGTCITKTLEFKP
jgi:hypothetical protein